MLVTLLFEAVPAQGAAALSYVRERWGTDCHLDKRLAFLVFDKLCLDMSSSAGGSEFNVNVSIYINMYL